MSLPHREVAPSDAPPLSADPPSPAPPALNSQPVVTRTRVSAALVSICTAGVALVVLVIFMLQNTRSVEITFLWMHGNVPLALALLTAAVGVAILAVAVGEARIGQLRRLARRPR